ncbi:alpha/beta fold hydrolase [Paludibacter jiangxiensis]|uniref:Pimeloyl-ACP methyl ester carboxylesterase n=1 Tax=Paludibacter jiangxiensis TaxID=681398 RepID=A0A170ZAW6_9BACT|nr:alpha/beta fold hydrolase [Paludibacter jiangxiensis]GAT62479.1 pimeloyl-ACP methyl ester carboxylesterase [Paludibacter jiangxiensis]
MKKVIFLLIINLVLDSMIINGQVVDTLIDNGGYKLHFSILPGKGMPILFETGYRDNIKVWQDIVQSISEITGAPVISYDRQGFGKSTIDSKCKSIKDEIAGLETALSKLGYFKEIMLVSHSLGGFYNTVYAIRNKEKVKGIVFVDASMACIFSDDVIDKMGLNSSLLELVKTMKQLPPLSPDIPVIDIISEQNVMRDNRWKTCHDNFVSEAPNRKGILAFKTSHYIFRDNNRLVTDAIVSLYADIQKPKVRSAILEKAYAHELASANDDYRKLVEYQHSYDDLNAWSKSLSQNGDLTKALQVMELNAKFYPEKTETISKLAETFLKIGDKESAEAYYKKAKELNLDNKNTTKILEQISKIVFVPESLQSQYIGQYELNKMPISIIRENNKLFLSFNNTKSAMYFVSDADFFIAEYRDEIKIQKDPDGKISGLLFRGLKAIKLK